MTQHNVFYSDTETSINCSPMGLAKHGHFDEVVNLQRFSYMFHRHLGHRNKGLVKKVVELYRWSPMEVLL